MARFDRQGRPVPLDRSKVRGLGDRSPAALDDFAGWARECWQTLTAREDRLGPRESVGKTIWSIAVFVFIAVQFATSFVGDDDEAGEAVQDEPRTRISPLRPLPETTSALASVDVADLLAAQRDDPDLLRLLLDTRFIEVRGTVLATDLDSETTDRLTLGREGMGSIELDVDSAADASIRSLSPGEDARFMCARGLEFEGEILLFECRPGSARETTAPELRSTLER